MSPSVLVCGTFDHLHEGHVFLLSEALTHGAVTVLVARDATVERIKGFMPDESLEERMRAIAERFPMVTVVAGDEHDVRSSITTINPDLLVLGYDQKLPPPMTDEDLSGITILRVGAYFPEQYKSSLLRKEKKSGTMS